MTPEDVLRGAIEVINEKGWCRGWLQTVDGRVCLWGAVYTAGGFTVEVCDRHEGCRVNTVEPDPYLNGDMLKPVNDAVNRVQRVLDSEGIDDTPVVWNDRVTTSADDVIHVLKRAIDVEL